MEPREQSLENRARDERVSDARIGRLLVSVLVVTALAACSSTTASGTQTPVISSAASAAPATTPAPTSAAAVATLTGCPAATSLSNLAVVARLSGGPDDAVSTPAGDVWVSEHDAGRLIHLSASGAVLQTVTDANGPEGLIALTGGQLLVAQQNPDRIDRFDPARGTFTPWLQLESAPAGQGVDSIHADGASVLVPDSSGGRLLVVALLPDLGAGAQRVIATGLGRPVDAVALGDGSYAVAVENVPGIDRVSANGAVTPLTHTTSVDDLVVLHGLVYATQLVAYDVIAVNPATGEQRVLVTGAPDPQGLTADPSGRLLLADEVRGVLAAVTSCG